MAKFIELLLSTGEHPLVSINVDKIQYFKEDENGHTKIYISTQIADSGGTRVLSVKEHYTTVKEKIG